MDKSCLGLEKPSSETGCIQHLTEESSGWIAQHEQPGGFRRTAAGG
jgi:hypothetical protein